MGIGRTSGVGVRSLAWRDVLPGAVARRRRSAERTTPLMEAATAIAAKLLALPPGTGPDIAKTRWSAMAIVGRGRGGPVGDPATIAAVARHVAAAGGRLEPVVVVPDPPPWFPASRRRRSVIPVRDETMATTLAADLRARGVPARAAVVAVPRPWTVAETKIGDIGILFHVHRPGVPAPEPADRDPSGFRRWTIADAPPIPSCAPLPSTRLKAIVRRVLAQPAPGAAPPDLSMDRWSAVIHDDGGDRMRPEIPIGELLATVEEAGGLVLAVVTIPDPPPWFPSSLREPFLTVVHGSIAEADDMAAGLRACGVPARRDIIVRRPEDVAGAGSVTDVVAAAMGRIRPSGDPVDEPPVEPCDGLRRVPAADGATIPSVDHVDERVAAIATEPLHVRLRRLLIDGAGPRWTDAVLNGLFGNHATLAARIDLAGGVHLVPHRVMAAVRTAMTEPRDQPTRRAFALACAPLAAACPAIRRILAVAAGDRSLSDADRDVFQTIVAVVDGRTILSGASPIVVHLRPWPAGVPSEMDDTTPCVPRAPLVDRVRTTCAARLRGIPDAGTWDHAIATVVAGSGDWEDIVVGGGSIRHDILLARIQSAGGIAAVPERVVATVEALIADAADPDERRAIAVACVLLGSICDGVRGTIRAMMDDPRLRVGPRGVAAALAAAIAGRTATEAVHPSVERLCRTIRDLRGPRIGGP